MLTNWHVWREGEEKGIERKGRKEKEGVTNIPPTITSETFFVTRTYFLLESESRPVLGLLLSLHLLHLVLLLLRSNFVSGQLLAVLALEKKKEALTKEISD